MRLLAPGISFIGAQERGDSDRSRHAEMDQHRHRHPAVVHDIHQDVFAASPDTRDRPAVDLCSRSAGIGHRITLPDVQTDVISCPLAASARAWHTVSTSGNSGMMLSPFLRP